MKKSLLCLAAVFAVALTLPAAVFASGIQSGAAVYTQEKYNGAWRNATGVPVKIYRKTITNSYSISAARTFTLVKGKVYRAKIRFVDTNSTGTYYKTRYTCSF